MALKDSELRRELVLLLNLDPFLLKKLCVDLLKENYAVADKNVAAKKNLTFIKELAEHNTRLAWLLLVDFIAQKYNKKSKSASGCIYPPLFFD